MRNLKKVLRLIGLVVLIVLACFGLGFMGGIPIPEKRRRENIVEFKNEDENIDEATVFYKQE